MPMHILASLFASGNISFFTIILKKNTAVGNN